MMASLESKQLIGFLRSSNGWNKPLQEVRKDLEGISGEFEYLNRVERCRVSAGGVTAEWLIPPGAPKDKVIVYLHGGGYCLGIVDTNRNFAARMACECGYKVFVVDYRLAPENPYPAAIEDSVAAYRWLLVQGYLPRNIVFAADSSGCGLSLVTLTLLREKGELLPAAQAYICPTIDFSYQGESIRTRAELDPFQLKPEFYISNHYVAGNDPVSPHISPIYADLQGLPPMLVHAGDWDIFLSDSLRLAEKAEAVGVQVQLKVWDEMWHIFHMYADYLPEGRDALGELCSYIKGMLA